MNTLYSSIESDWHGTIQVQFRRIGLQYKQQETLGDSFIKSRNAIKSST